jgi:hypothetical protein
MKFNGNDRFDKLAAKYFRSVQIYQHHSGSPENHIYMFSFALYPEQNQPSGTCNFSKIDDAQLIMEFNNYILAGYIYYRNRI